MNQNTSNLLIYRVREQGLEVFMVEDEQGNPMLPQSQASSKVISAMMADADKVIELEMVEKQKSVAVEADWHEIPSLKSLIAEDVDLVKNTIKEMMPNMMEKGTYFAVKEAFKKVLPNQYQALKELKDIVTERNMTNY
jgi:predicted DCC family thiol-disulfide oxidoreductase YuxK